jgi:cobalt-zinc-cadmium efflux system outer membrane protein
MRVACTALALASVSLCSSAASAQAVLTLEDVLSRARTQAPQVIAARMAIEEARGSVLGASVRLSSNPELDLSVGSRDAVGARSTDFQFGVSQMLDPRGQRAARIEGAMARVDQATATADATARDALRTAASMFYRAVYSTEQVRMLASSEELATGIYQIAERRARAGDLAALDVNLARATLARARASREVAEAERLASLGALRAVLGLAQEIAVQGRLERPAVLDVNSLAVAVQQRPQLAALEHAIREAEAEVKIGRTFSKPSYGFGARYEREGDDQIVLGGFTVSLPVFSKGQELRATGMARAARLRAELTAARTRTEIELKTAVASYERRLSAARVLETDALPSLDDNDTLTTRSFDVGQIGLPDVLLIRREALETRLQHLSLLLEAALARVDVDAAAGVLR